MSVILFNCLVYDVVVGSKPWLTEVYLSGMLYSKSIMWFWFIK